MENINQTLLATRVKALRKIARLSQEEVASKLGITLYNFKTFEEGTKKLDGASVVKLSTLFNQDLTGIDSEIILSGKNHKLTKIMVKRENRYFINEFVREFIKIDASAQEAMVQIIQKLGKSV